MSSNASGGRSTERARLHHQRGVTVTGLIVVSVLIIIVLLIGMKVVPVYVEYFTIEKNFRAIAQDPSLATARRAELLRAWSGRATVDNITALRDRDVVFERDGDQWVVSAEYSVKVPLYRHVNFCFDFQPSSR
jgi:Domain of unknown function (DUF4845)